MIPDLEQANRTYVGIFVYVVEADYRHARYARVVAELEPLGIGALDGFALDQSVKDVDMLHTRIVTGKTRIALVLRHADVIEEILPVFFGIGHDADVAVHG